MKSDDPKLTICGFPVKMISCGISYTFTEESKMPIDVPGGSIEFDMNYDFSHPFFLQFEPDLSDWPYPPLVLICPQRVSKILFSQSSSSTRYG